MGIIRAMLVWVSLTAVAVLGIVAWRLRTRVADLDRQATELRLLRRELEQRVDELERGLQVTRTHLVDVAGGAAPERDAILAGKAWRDVLPAPALVLWEQNPNLFVLDVRTEPEWTNGHIPRAHLVPLDELEDRLRELPAKDTPILVHCAAGGRSLQACQILADKGWTRLLNLAGGMHAWAGPREQPDRSAEPPPANVAQGTAVTHRGGGISEGAVVGALRQCFDPEIPLNIYDLGLVYGIDIGPEAIAVRMTLTSEACPSARTIPEDVRKRIAALGQDNVRVDVVFDPPWHPSRISDEGKQKLGLA
jgi:metal-sulfur cluster biosynthetic enzyme/rhodanese-related sulfurtransferase